MQPLISLRGGMYLNSGSLYGLNTEGGYWLRYVPSSIASDFYFAAEYLAPTNGNTRGFGFTLRCLAR